MNLHEAIKDATNEQGIVDPHEAAQWIITHQSKEWLGRALVERADEFIAFLIRRDYSHRRAVASGRVGAAGAPSYRDVYGVCDFVPGVGWKCRVDLSEDDCVAIATDYRLQALAMTGRADEFDRYAVLIAEAGVSRLGDVAGLVLEAA
jgi:hypothetical protein